MRTPTGGGAGDPPITEHQTNQPTHVPYDASLLSDRIALWDGDVTELDVDAIVRWTDNTLTSNDDVLRAIGTDLKEHLLSHVYDRRAGSVVVTSGFSLQCRHILHIILTQSTGNAARDDTLLHQAYRSALDKAIELGANSVAIGPVQLSRHTSQLDNALRILLCSVRSVLVCNPKISVVLATPPGVEPGPFLPCNCVYRIPTPEENSKIDERRIRIIHNPQSNFYSTDDETSLYDEERSANAAAALLACTIDTQPLLADPPHPRVDRDDDQHLHEYERLLRRAQTEDLSSISGIGCLYQSGVDRLGRPVVIFIGKWFPFNEIDLEKAMLYLIKLLDPIVRGDYVIAYFHTLASAGNHPPFSWLRDVYTVLPYKYKKNLKAFYIVHPTFWTKMMTWWFTTFMAPAIKAKVHSLPGLEYLYSVMARDQLEVPAFVTEYDMTINGLHYFQPDTPNT